MQLNAVRAGSEEIYLLALAAGDAYADWHSAEIGSLVHEKRGASLDCTVRSRGYIRTLTNEPGFCKSWPICLRRCSAIARRSTTRNSHESDGGKSLKNSEC
jgi:hypothetical protein